jgi:repressor of nif and glnA expression
VLDGRLVDSRVVDVREINGRVFDGLVESARANLVVSGGWVPLAVCKDYAVDFGIGAPSAVWNG